MLHMHKYVVSMLAIASLAAAEDPGPRSPPINKVEERYRDKMGYELVLKHDDKGNVKAEAFDPEGKPVEVVTRPIESTVLCWPKAGASDAGGFDAASNQCQRVSFVSDGAFIKVGSASCTCYPCNNTWVCYGGTCH